jgi:dolichyl-phosphate-mannose-protein mannosyltransferase
VIQEKQKVVSRSLDSPVPAEGIWAIPARATSISDWIAARSVPIILAGALVGGAGLRFWHINSAGFNSDEAVYAGQAAALAGDPQLSKFFPIFRAHPMLFQFLLSIMYRVNVSDVGARTLIVLIGLVTIFLVYKVGALLYGPMVGAIAALLMAVMPYHVVVTRQVLLDGPLTLCTTLTLYLVARFAITQRPIFLYATGASLGLVFLAKETGFVLSAAVYAFFALTPQIRIRIRDLILSGMVMMVPIFAYPVSTALAGRSDTAKGYLVWQLFRRSNHSWTFFPTVVPPAIGPLVLIAAVAGLWFLRRERSWRETLLIAWILVPCFVFQLWPVKGFQYLLPVAPAIAILAGRALIRVPELLLKQRQALMSAVQVGLVLVVALSLTAETWDRLQPPAPGKLLAGAGGMPGGREAGHWIDENTPENSVFLTIGPSMANIVQFYGHRKAYGLSVSANPLHRNPSYEPVQNADLKIRSGEAQYLVFDVYSAARTSYFRDRMDHLVKKYKGRIVHVEYLPGTATGAENDANRIIIIYEVYPDYEAKP